MSLYLAIDTATDLGSVAVGEPGRTVAEVLFTERRHASVLTPAIQEVLRLAGATPEDLTGILFAEGPGSFTGLRIGLATAKGIMAARDALELYTAPSLLSAAWAGTKFVQGPVAALYDAYRGDVFGAVYEGRDGSIETLVAPVCCPLADLVQRSPVTPVVAVGDGAVLYADAVASWTGRAPIGPPAGSPRAGALLELMAMRGIVGLVEDPDAFEPTYGRYAAAQDRWEAAHGRQLPDSPGHRS